MITTKYYKKATLDDISENDEDFVGCSIQCKATSSIIKEESDGKFKTTYSRQHRGQKWQWVECREI